MHQPPFLKPSRPQEFLRGNRQAYLFQVAGRKAQISQQLGARVAAALQRPAVVLPGARDDGDEGHLNQGRQGKVGRKAMEINPDGIS